MTDTQVRDRLARQRTQLANERTLLAYIRTALGLFIVGVTAVWLLDQPTIQVLGGISLAAGMLCLGIGLWRFMSIRAVIEAQEPLDTGSSIRE